MRTSKALPVLRLRHLSPEAVHLRSRAVWYLVAFAGLLNDCNAENLLVSKDEQIGGSKDPADGSQDSVSVRLWNTMRESLS